MRDARPLWRAQVKRRQERLYRIRVGDYRIVYAVDHAEQRVIILYVRHRRNVYRGL
ncbi:type II toxin-antitoxin system RelE family toxin [Methanoculleus bourgensis]|uniref:type II toxin-antitoxin system RelE family toxin n=1 Tax=Methanoculleus bourgensis TaxID=83986 RepID=UPI00373AEDDF